MTPCGRNGSWWAAMAGKGFRDDAPLYRPHHDGARLIQNNIQTAELAKTPATPSCDEDLVRERVARLSMRAGADVTAIAEVRTDPRIGRAFLDRDWVGAATASPRISRPSAAVGQPRLRLQAPARSSASTTRRSARRSTRLRTRCGTSRTSASRCWACRSSPETDDVRLSPALALAGRLLDGGRQRGGLRPRGGGRRGIRAPGARGGIERVRRARRGCTAWWSVPNGTSSGRWTWIERRGSLAHPIVVDGRNIFDPAEMEIQGGSCTTARDEPPTVGCPDLDPCGRPHGGAGFLGSHLCERLLHEGWRGRCFDSLLTGQAENLSTRWPRSASVRSHDGPYITDRGGCQPRPPSRLPGIAGDYSRAPSTRSRSARLGPSTRSASRSPRVRASSRIHVGGLR